MLAGTELHSKFPNTFVPMYDMMMPTIRNSLLASCATVLIFGQLYSFYSMKAVFEISFLIFVVGSVLSAAAPSSAAFIAGRALSGLGSAGVFAGGSM